MSMRGLMLTITYSCDNACIFCATGIPYKKNNDLSLRQIINILEQENVDRNTVVCLNGGEPLVRKDIIRVLEIIKKKGAKIKILTNGVRLSDFKFASIIANYVDHFYVSMYAHTADLYGFLTGVESNYYKMVEGIKNLFRLKEKSCIDIKLLVCKPTAPYLKEMVSFISAQFPKPRKIIITGLTIAGSAERNFDRVGIRLTNAIPFIKEAVDYAVSLGFDVLLRCIPPCMFDDPLYHRFCLGGSKVERSFLDEAIIYEQGIFGGGFPIENYGPECKNCIFYRRCMGLWEGYALKYGYDELRPVKLFV
ncbi:MAG: radical SAM protein [Nitrososphaeria archaeon]